MLTRKTRNIALAAILATAIGGTGITAAAQNAQGNGYGTGPGMMGGYRAGPGMMSGYGAGPGMMSGYGVGPGMMGGFGMGPGMMGWGGQVQRPVDLKLSVSDVKLYFERWLALAGNPHVKVGNVVAKNADTITADIVTTDKDALVQRYDVNPHTGFFRPDAG